MRFAGARGGFEYVMKAIRHSVTVLGLLLLFNDQVLTRIEVGLISLSLAGSVKRKPSNPQGMAGNHHDRACRRSFKFVRVNKYRGRTHPSICGHIIPDIQCVVPEEHCTWKLKLWDTVPIMEANGHSITVVALVSSRDSGSNSVSTGTPVCKECIFRPGSRSTAAQCRTLWSQNFCTAGHGFMHGYFGAHIGIMSSSSPMPQHDIRSSKQRQDILP
ncbi:hypothetical protein DFH06DRAFT_118975 [Mycena polygramma]|nr:hypothetical protein DFH06DRAFT_118975 [Mycena polygramma]